MTILFQSGIRSFLIALSVSLWAMSSSLAADNDSGPLPDEEDVCAAANALCQHACDQAKYTAAQRSQCGTGCQATYERCTGRAAKRAPAIKPNTSSRKLNRVQD